MLNVNSYNFLELVCQIREERIREHYEAHLRECRGDPRRKVIEELVRVETMLRQCLIAC